MREFSALISLTTREQADALMTRRPQAAAVMNLLGILITVIGWGLLFVCGVCNAPFVYMTLEWYELLQFQWKNQ